MRTTANHRPVVIIGAGHAGLAMSRRLTDRSIEHVLLERGEVANSWRSERWPSLRLLTPNWQTRLPGHHYDGPDPDGFMPVSEVVDFVSAYATAIDAPVRTGTEVQSVRVNSDGYEITTDQGAWHAHSVVLASGACNVPVVPACAEALPSDITSISPMSYRGPDELPDRGVLVVGASATGVQLAQEIKRSGRPVTVSTGEHVRVPRTYRGRDFFWWMERAGVLDERYDEIDDIVRARHLPSPQLIGTPERATIDLNSLVASGIRLVGRIGRISESVAQFAGSLPNVCKLADLKMNRLLNTFDEWATEAGADHEVDPPHRFDATHLAGPPPLELDLGSGEIGAVIWATGYRPDYSWLDLPVLDRKGHVRHDGGVVADAPGIYLLGTPLLRRRASTFLHGAVQDTEVLAEHLHHYLDSTSVSSSAI